jgi:hypothetical protein
MNQYSTHTENNGHALQAHDSVNVLKKRSDLENLDREIPYSFLKKKAEKLSTAVYVVTSFLSDNEPLKWQIRECGLEILSGAISIKDTQISETSHRVKKIISSTEKIISLLEIAGVAGFVSLMNLGILKEEYGSLLESISAQKIGKPEGGYIFTKEFFESKESETVPLSEKKNFQQENFQEKFNAEPKKDITKDIEIIQEKAPLQSAEINTKTESKPAPQEGESISKSSRRDTIVLLIKDKGLAAEVSIKDIVGHFSDCGEKTIQRELTALVEDGVLKKTGERRWSRYSLNIK